MALYKRGDIVAVQFPFTDISQTKKRPALVISNEIVNDTGDYLLVQITSQVKKDSLSIPINESDFEGNSLPLHSFLRIHKVFLLNESLIISKITSAKPSFLSLIITDFSKLIS
ncbi:type II toxin-antitoxin system PemK/MazF family toxin [Dyadobacter psychrotolerans]|uniref:Type II toxin-antitoxin system PemK/MazF family toxin n=1 Tax=Dyadobacter psychrotolerans TaxID=2541721 RepID=A0A4R5DDP5_9BACT|nr:type II toxin-antitoxin system PemK/MazF family toxin [Dyadobacter psychrotolerans]TDE11962.1 type II toxin-antitoxin system PemK/MazF family toxin [Dyadobacter psychrotolerans]